MTLTILLQRLDKPGRDALAFRCVTTVAYLYQLAGGHRTPSLKMIDQIEKGSDGLVTRMDWSVKQAA